MFSNRITQLFAIEKPIIQAGMIWTSGWKLASAASENGCLGLIGSASMYPDVLREHIQKCNTVTQKPFGVNLQSGVTAHFKATKNNPKSR